MSVKSKRSIKIGRGVAIATVDFGGKNNVGYCRCVHGMEMKPFDFTHTHRGYTMFYDRVMEFSRGNGCGEVIVGYESTSVYAWPFVNFLQYRPVSLVQVHPVHVKRARQITDNSPNKTDKKDPKVIADLIEMKRFLTVPIPEGVIAELRGLIHARERVLERLKAIQSQLHDLVFVLFPELLEILGSVRCRTVQQFLSRWPRPIDVVAAGEQEVAIRLRSWSRGRRGKKEASVLYRAAHVSVGIRHGQQSAVSEIGLLLEQVALVRNQQQRIEAQIAQQLRACSLAQYILSIPRMGVIMTAGILAELSDVQSFSSVEQVLKFAGLNLYEISSGRRRGRRRISKRGRSLVRKFLYYATLNMITHGGIFQDYYVGYVANGLKKLEALVALERKLLRIIFALVKSEKPFSLDTMNAMQIQKVA